MRVLCALSGGVDSAVAASRLQRDGADVVGVHLRTGVEADGEGAGGGRSCCGADDARDARRVAARLGLPFYVVDVADAFAGILEDFVASYASGRTPNPCVLCNRDVKFGRLLDLADDLACDVVATGHYARTEVAADGRHRLLRGLDSHKDQSYVLFPLDQRQLARARFPLGTVASKDAVRREALDLGFEVADKPDSQDLCFVPGGDPRRFLREHAPQTLVPGEIYDRESGRVVGRHEGAAAYTLGQRKGLPAVGAARYVAKIDAPGGRLEIAGRAAMGTTEVRADRVNWIEVPPPASGVSFRVEARIRHASRPQPARLAVEGEGRAVRVRFEAPVFAPAPGQALVAYAGDAVLCGGTITPADREL